MFVHLHETDTDAVEEVEQLRGRKGKEDTPQPCNLWMKLSSKYSSQSHLSSVGWVGERALVYQVKMASGQVRGTEWQRLYLVMSRHLAHLNIQIWNAVTSAMSNHQEGCTLGYNGGCQSDEEDDHHGEHLEGFVSVLEEVVIFPLRHGNLTLGS